MNSSSSCKTLLLVSILRLLLFPVIAAAQETHPAHWAYSGEDGPKHWADSILLTPRAPSDIPNPLSTSRKRSRLIFLR